MAYDQALVMLEPIVRDRPGDPAMTTAEVRLHAGRLLALRDDGRLPQAIEAFRRVADLGDRLLADGGGTGILPEILARAYLSGSFALRYLGRTDEALRASLRAHALAVRAAADRPDDREAARTLLWVARITTEQLVFKGRLDEALSLCERGIAFGRARAAVNLRDIELRLYLAGLESKLGEIEKSRGRSPEALRIYRAATETLGALAREHPLLVRPRVNWATALTDLSQLQTDLGAVCRGGTIRPNVGRPGRDTCPGGPDELLLSDR